MQVFGHVDFYMSHCDTIQESVVVLIDDVRKLLMSGRYEIIYVYKG